MRLPWFRAYDSKTLYSKCIVNMLTSLMNVVNIHYMLLTILILSFPFKAIISMKAKIYAYDASLSVHCDMNKLRSFKF